MIGYREVCAIVNGVLKTAGYSLSKSSILNQVAEDVSRRLMPLYPNLTKPLKTPVLEFLRVVAGADPGTNEAFESLKKLAEQLVELAKENPALAEEMSPDELIVPEMFSDLEEVLAGVR